MHVNLLSLDYQRRQVIRLRFWQWTTIWLALAPVLVGAGLWQWSQYQASSLRLTSTRSRHAPLETLKRENERLAARLNELAAREQLVLRLADQRSVLAVLGQVSGAAAATDGDIAVQRLHVTDVSGSESAAAAPSGLTLEGVGADHTAIARFVAGLREGSAFREVKLASTAPLDATGRDDQVRPVRQFKVECSE